MSRPPLSIQAMLDHRARLTAQCPPAVAPHGGAEAAALPIHVTERGTSGPTVLIVHGGVQGGLGGGATTFARQEALAAFGWRLRLVDRPGFGQSPSRGVDDMVADAAWMAELLGTGAHVVGHSWGGAAALLAAARRPEAVRSLVLVEPAMQPLLTGDPILEEDPAVAADAARTGATLLATETPAAYALAFARSLSSNAAGKSGGNVGATPATPHAPNPVAALEADPARATRVGCALLQARMAPPDVTRQAAATVAAAGIPVLVITGGWSRTFDAVGAIAARLTGGRHVIVPSPNHFPQLANADAFNATLDAFLRAADVRHTG